MQTTSSPGTDGQTLKNPANASIGNAKLSGIGPPAIIKLNKGTSHQQLRPKTAGHKRPPIQNRMISSTKASQQHVDFHLDIQQVQQMTTTPMTMNSGAPVLNQSPGRQQQYGMVAGSSPEMINASQSEQQLGFMAQTMQSPQVPFYQSAEGPMFQQQQQPVQTEKVQQSAADPQFSLTVAGPSQRRPVSAMKPSTSPGQTYTGSLGALPLLKPPTMVMPKPRPVRGASAITSSTHQRLDNRSQSTGSNNLQYLAGLSSTGPKSHAGGAPQKGSSKAKGKGKKSSVKRRNGGGSSSNGAGGTGGAKSLIQKKASQNFKYVTQLQNNWVANSSNSNNGPAQPQRRQRPGSAIVKHEIMCRENGGSAVEEGDHNLQQNPPLLRQSSDPLQPQAEMQPLQHQTGSQQQLSQQQPHNQSDKGEPQLFYQVYNYYGSQNNHHYNNQHQANSYATTISQPSSATGTATALQPSNNAEVNGNRNSSYPRASAANSLPSQLFQQDDPRILAQNLPPDEDRHQMLDLMQADSQDHQNQFDKGGVHATSSSNTTKLQNRKHMLMTSKIPTSSSTPTLAAPQHQQQHQVRQPHPQQQVLHRIPEGQQRQQRHQQQFNNNYSDSEGGPGVGQEQNHSYLMEPSDMTLLGRSLSVDTDQFMRHLQRKGQNYDVLRSLDKHHSLRDLSKLERQMYVMEFMENAPSNNVFRQLKLNGLLEKQQNGNFSKKRELRRMLQQDEDWPSLAEMAHSDGEEMGYDNVLRGAGGGRRSNRRGDLGQYLPKNINQYSQMIKRIKLNDQYRKLQQLKNVYPYQSQQNQHMNRSISKSKSPHRNRSSLSPSAARTASQNNKQQILSNKHPLAQAPIRNFIVKKPDHNRDTSTNGRRRSIQQQKPRSLSKKFMESSSGVAEQQKTQNKRSKSRKRRQASKHAQNRGEEEEDSSRGGDDTPPPSRLHHQQSTSTKKNPRLEPLDVDHHDKLLRGGSEEYPLIDNSQPLPPHLVQLRYKSKSTFQSIRDSDYANEYGEEGIYEDNDTCGGQTAAEPQSPLEKLKSSSPRTKEIDQKRIDQQDLEIEHLKKQIETIKLKAHLESLQQKESKASSKKPSAAKKTEESMSAKSKVKKQQKATESSQQQQLPSHSDEQSQQQLQNDLHTIQSNHQIEQMQSSSNGQHEVDVEQVDNNMTSLLTETELDLESKKQSTIKNGSSVMDNTPKSAQQLVALFSQQQQAAASKESGSERQKNPKSASGIRVSSMEKDLKLPLTNLDMVQEEIRSLEKVDRSQEAAAAAFEKEEQSHKMFDIGEPSEAASRNLQAMMELDIDISKGLVSQKSSSITQSSNRNTNKDAAHVQQPRGSDKNQKTMDSADRPQQRPPLLKMRTSVEAPNKKRNGKLAKSIDGGPNQNQTSCEGGHAGVRSEQFAALEQSSAKVTMSNQHTIQAISVVQIPAAPHNESSHNPQQKQLMANGQPVQNSRLPEEGLSHDSSNRPNTTNVLRQQDVVPDEKGNGYLFKLPEGEQSVSHSPQGLAGAPPQSQQHRVYGSFRSTSSSPDNNTTSFKEETILTNREQEPVLLDTASKQQEVNMLIESNDNDVSGSLADKLNFVQKKIQQGKDKWQINPLLQQEEEDQPLQQRQAAPSNAAAQTQTEVKLHQAEDNQQPSQQIQQQQQQQFAQSFHLDARQLFKEIQEEQIKMTKQSLDEHAALIREQTQQMLKEERAAMLLDQKQQLQQKQQLLDRSHEREMVSRQPPPTLSKKHSALSISMEQQYVVVRSPFEQELIEMLAYASTQPKTPLQYPATPATPRIMVARGDAAAAEIDDSFIGGGETAAAKGKSSHQINVSNIAQSIFNNQADSQVNQTKPAAVVNKRVAEALKKVQQVLSKLPERVSEGSHYQEPIDITLGLPKELEQSGQATTATGLPGGPIGPSTAMPLLTMQEPMAAGVAEASQLQQLQQNTTGDRPQLNASSRVTGSPMSSACLSTQRAPDKTLFDDLSGEPQRNLTIAGLEYRVRDLIKPERFAKKKETRGSSSSDSCRSDTHSSAPSQEILLEESPGQSAQSRSISGAAPEAPAIDATSGAGRPILERPPSQSDIKSTGSSGARRWGPGRNSSDALLPAKLPLSQQQSPVLDATGSFSNAASTPSLFRPRSLTRKRSTGEVTPATAVFGASSPFLHMRMNLHADEDKFFSELQPVEEQAEEAGLTPQKKPGPRGVRQRPSMLKLQSQIVGATEQVPRRSLAGLPKKRSNNWLRRASTIAFSKINSGLAHEVAISAALEDKKQKMMSKQFDKLFTTDSIKMADEKDHAKGIFSSDEKGSDDQSEIDESDYEASYWVFENDAFNFEHMKFSIVTSEHIREIESKFLNQVTWNVKLKAKAIHRNLSRMTTQMQFNRNQSIKSIYSNKGSNNILPIQFQEGMYQSNKGLSSGGFMSPLKLLGNNFGGAQAVTGLNAQIQKKINNKKMLKSQSVYEQPLPKFAMPSPEKISKITSEEIQLNQKSYDGSSFELHNAENELYSWLKAEFPIKKTKELLRLKKLNKKRVCINVTDLMAEELAQLKIEVLPNKMARVDSSFNQSFSKASFLTSSPIKQTSIHKRQNLTASKNANKLNQLLNITMHCSDMTNQLKTVMMRQQSSMESEQQSPYLNPRLFSNSTWEIQADEYGRILEELEKHGKNNIDQVLDIDQKGQASLYLSLYKNEFIMATKLFAKTKLVVLKEPTLQKFMSRKRLHQAYLNYLQSLLGEICFASYSKHLWNVSQWTKNHYARQGDRALNFFESLLKHNDDSLRCVVRDSQAQMQVFMRRSTIRQEIQDTLFQRKTELLFDEDYVKRTNRSILVEKIRQTIQKSCQTDSMYQYKLRMAELDSLPLLNPREQLADEKPKGYTQFSKMLIFINFHKRDEGKRWVHQDYMDSLRRRDVDTPRSYSLPKNNKPRLSAQNNFSKLSQQNTMKNLRSQTTFTRQSSISARSFARNQTVKKNYLESLDLSTEPRRPPEKAFPFKLNDCFGYWTLVITDGCYQILVPARPPQKSKKPQALVTCLSDGGDMTPIAAQRKALSPSHGGLGKLNQGNEKGQATFSSYFNELKVSDAPYSSRFAVKQNLVDGGEETPMTLGRQQDFSSNRLHETSSSRPVELSFEGSQKQKRATAPTALPPTPNLFSGILNKIEEKKSNQTKSSASPKINLLGKGAVKTPGGDTSSPDEMVSQSLGSTITSPLKSVEAGSTPGAGSSNPLAGLFKQILKHQDSSKTSKDDASQSQTKGNSIIPESNLRPKQATFTEKHIQVPLGKINEHQTEVSSGGNSPMQWGDGSRHGTPSAAMTEKNKQTPGKQTTTASPLGLFSLGVMPTIKISTVNKESNAKDDDEEDDLQSNEGESSNNDSESKRLRSIQQDSDVESVSSRFTMDLSEEEEYEKSCAFAPAKYAAGQQLGANLLKPGINSGLMRFKRSDIKSWKLNESDESKSPKTPMSPLTRLKKMQQESSKKSGELQKSSTSTKLAPSHSELLKVLKKKSSNRNLRDLNKGKKKKSKIASSSRRAAATLDKANNAQLANEEKKVGNIVRKVITSIGELSDTRLSNEQKRHLIGMGMKNPKRPNRKNSLGRGQASVSNTSLLTVSPGRSVNNQSSSPNKQTQRQGVSKHITVVRELNFQETVDEWRGTGVVVDSNIKEFSKNAILPLQADQPKSTLTATLMAIKFKQDQNKQNQSSSEQKPSGGAGMMAQLQNRFTTSLFNVKQATKKVETKKFLKYQVVKPKISKNLLNTKSPETKKRQKKAYEDSVEQGERNKVFHAIEFNQIQVVEAYIKSHMLGCDVTDYQGNTLLSIAAQHGCYDICNLLIKEGANVNTQNNQGNTPLHYAIAYNMSAICDLLVENGAIETIKNKKRMSPWQGI